jgi:hypothetical protein
MKAESVFESIYQYVKTLPVFSDHEHHQSDAEFKDYTLDKALQKAYVSWTGYVPDGTEQSRRRLLRHVRFNSYYEWFERGVQKVHGIDTPITVENWDEISARITRRYAADKDFHWRSLLDNGYERLVQDSYWNPGSDEGHPEALTPAFRIDKFMWGYHAESRDQDNFCPWERYQFTGSTLDDWIELMRTRIIQQHARGAVVTLKCAEAYNRSIAFVPDDRSAARRAFGLHPREISEESRMLFGNYVFNRACELAQELDIPFQVHTGLAKLSGSQPMKLEPLLWRYPGVRFVLFHSGYPWTHEVAGLAHNYGNVLPNLTWTATISTSAAVRALHEYIDVSSSINHITWGSDSFNAEDSVGALLAWRYIVAKVLSERCADRRLSIPDAEWLARKLMYGNGRYVYLKREDEL